ncbi:MAG: GNAT family N-acetyltransferase, partial [Fuerstiella sp.]|nr:GNAT family N-acetyltransferase [Fuerstiella sp.]
MRQSDLDAVAAIEAATYNYPWSINIFRDCLLAGYSNFVLDSDGEPVGYGIMSIAAGEAHLLNICVLERLRRQGVGRRLLDCMMQLAQQSFVERMYLEV